MAPCALAKIINYYYSRPPCAPAFIKSATLHISYFFEIPCTYTHREIPRVPPQVLASAGGKYITHQPPNPISLPILVMFLGICMFSDLSIISISISIFTSHNCLSLLGVLQCIKNIPLVSMYKMYKEYSIRYFLMEIF